MSNFEITGTIHAITDETPAGAKTKRVIVINTGGKWPQFIPFEAYGDKVDLVSGLTEGEEATIEFELRGREYTNKDNQPAWFGSLGVRDITVKPKAKPVAKKAAPSRAADDMDITF